MNPAHFQLRHAEVPDRKAISALELATDSAPHWSPAAYAAILKLSGPPRCLIVAHVDEVLVGFAVGLIQMDPWEDDSPGHVSELESVVVAATARRTGIGRALCSAVIEWCKERGATEMILEVRATSAGAIALYAELGFTQTGRRPRYYRDPEDDAVLMRLQLDGLRLETLNGRNERSRKLIHIPKHRRG